MQGPPQEITGLIGREVYSNNGVFVGEIEDVRIDVGREAITGLALGELNADLFESHVERGQGVMLPYRWVRATGDVVLVNDIVERLADPEEEEAAAVA
ncbi:photosystem reaction center subunit H [Halobacteriales archaeon SW_7_71_33]|nr:MAG: photosystem reaction center subunit H [Halobacteriales archaeon SW_5_70_135]PSQ57514.1 MAG: photosystem reaction center subunit H [Halobacteriales archaeon SW_7_71_33]